MDRAAFARKLGQNGQQNVNNWLKRGKVGQSSAAQVRELLPRASIDWLNDGIGDPPTVGEPVGSDVGLSQSVKHETLTVALQLVAEVLDDQGLSLPTPKRAQLTASVYGLLDEGMPRAKVLHFVRAAVA